MTNRMGAAALAAGMALVLMGGAGIRTAYGASRFEFDAGGWNARISGYAYDTQSPSTSIDLRNDLNLQDNLNAQFGFTWRHGNRYLPDLDLGYTHIVSSGASTLHANITWGGVTYVANGRIHSQVMLKTGHVLAFWSPIDNSRFNLRTGIEFRWLNMNVPVSGTAEKTTPTHQTYQAETSSGDVAWIPMVHARFIAHLVAGLSASIQGSYIQYAKSYFFDVRTGLQYHFDSGLVLKAGWRRLRLNFDDSRFAVNGNLMFKGLYAEVGYAF